MKLNFFWDAFLKSNFNRNCVEREGGRPELTGKSVNVLGNSRVLLLFNGVVSYLEGVYCLVSPSIIMLEVPSASFNCLSVLCGNNSMVSSSVR